MYDVVIGIASWSLKLALALVVVALPVLYVYGQVKQEEYRDHGRRTGEW